jgi:hypothetical protein
MKKLITIFLCLYASISAVWAQQYYCQPYYTENKIRFYTTDNPVASAPYYALDLTADMHSVWGAGVTEGSINDVVTYNGKIFVSFDCGGKGGVLIYNYKDIYPVRNGTPPIIIKPQTPVGLSSAGIAINPANGDLFIPTFKNDVEGDDSGIYLCTAASNYTVITQFESFFNSNSVAEVCANLAFDGNGNLWMTTWSESNDPAEHYLICYKGLNKNNYYKIINTAAASYGAKDRNGTTINGLHLLSAPEGIAFDPQGNLWIGNNNDYAACNSIGQGTLVKINAGWINTLLGQPFGTYTVPSAQADVKYIQDGKLGGITFSGNNMYVNDQGQNHGKNFTINGTVWKWDATTPFNNTNFKASGIHTTEPGNGGGAIINNRYVIQDNAGDTGLEPNTTTSIFYESNDIGLGKVMMGQCWPISM